VPGKRLEDMSAFYISNADHSTCCECRKRQVYRIGWILFAPNSHMLALVSKYAIDARIGGWFKPTLPRIEQDPLEELETLTSLYCYLTLRTGHGKLRNG